MWNTLQGPLHELAEEEVHYLCIWSGTGGNKLIERFKAGGSSFPQELIRLTTR